MLHEGEVILDIEGEEREGLSVESLIAKFRDVRGAKTDSDALLL